MKPTAGAEPEQRVQWPVTVVQKDTTAEGGWYFVAPGNEPHQAPHVASETYIPQQQARQQLLDLAEEFEKRSATSTDGIRGAYIRAAQLCREKADA